MRAYETISIFLICAHERRVAFKDKNLIQVGSCKPHPIPLPMGEGAKNSVWQ
jgi:hypothetical protein